MFCLLRLGFGANIFFCGVACGELFCELFCGGELLLVI